MIYGDSEMPQNMRSIPKRVLVISHSGGMAGAETVLYEELRSLSGCFVFLLVVPSDSGLLESRIRDARLPVEIVKLNYRLYGNHMFKVFIKALFNIWAIFKVIRVIKKRKIDLIYTNSSVNWVGLLVAMFCKVPHVLHFHELPTPECSYIDKRIDFVFTYLIKKTKSKCVYISESMRDYWRHRCGLTGPDWVIYNPIKEIDSRISAKSAGDDEFAFGFAGTLYPRKNVPLLVNVFAKLIERYPRAKLYLAGDGPQMDEIKCLIKEKEVGSNVVLMGQLDKIEDLFCKIDVFVLPSIAEAMPLVVVEAIVANKACIVTTECGLHEILSDEKHCLYFNPFDDNALLEKMTFMIENENARLQMTERAKKAVSVMKNEEGYCKKWAEIFEFSKIKV